MIPTVQAVPDYIPGRQARTAAGREAAKRGKSLLARLPSWEGQLARQAAGGPGRGIGIQPGFCCRCGGPGRLASFKSVEDGQSIPRAMDWCGKGECKQVAAGLPDRGGAGVVNLPAEEPANAAGAREAA